MTEKTPKVDQKLLNMYFLRDVVIPHMRKPGTLVNFDHWVSRGYPDANGKCGTHRCLLGWYYFLRYGHDLNSKPSHVQAPEDFVAREFSQNLPWIFAGNNGGTLWGRECALRVHIATYERAHGIGDVEE